MRTRRRRSFDPRDRATWKGIPITTVLCTLVDIAGVFNEQQLAWAVHQAQVRHGTDPEQVEAVLARRPGATGRALLLSLLSGDAHITLSELERTFLARLRRESLPLPQANRQARARGDDFRRFTYGDVFEHPGPMLSELRSFFGGSS